MKPWVELYAAHRDGRTVPKPWNSTVRKRLIALASAGHCATTTPYRFTHRKVGELREFFIRPEQQQDSGAPLQDIAGLETAELTILALVGRREHLHALTVAVEGSRPDGSTWTIAVHLPDDRKQDTGGDRQGLGACSHAALHCHVGPGFDAAPKVRVPLPALGPVEVVDWVISQIVPELAFEPAPWPAVLAALDEQHR